MNVHAPYLLSKAALPDMVAQKWGRIIAVGSIAGKLPTPFGVGYSATKAAVPMPPQIFSMPMATAIVHRCCGVTASTQ